MPDDPTLSIRPTPEPRYSRSLEYGVAILRCFIADRPVLRLSELAEMVDISRSTTHRYASTLVELGCLEQDDKRRYRLTHHAAGPGTAAVETVRLETPTAVKTLEDLREQTGHTVSMGVLDGTRVLYTHRLFAHGLGQYEADLGLGVGAHIPVHCTAIGKALLASLSAPDQREALAALTLKRRGPNTITSKRALAEELARIRSDGLAPCDEEQAPGVLSLAAAISHPGRSKPMAVSVDVPAQHSTIKAIIAKLGPHMKAAAERI
ncbi:MAG TPA: IclR family transcriptional regulator [Solirubrobacteraceae bacterium]